MDGNKVPQDLVTKVGEAFESILEEACLCWLCSLNLFFMHMYNFGLLMLTSFKQANQVRAENSEDMSVSCAISIVFKRRPDLRFDIWYNNVF